MCVCVCVYGRFTQQLRFVVIVGLEFNCPSCVFNDRAMISQKRKDSINLILNMLLL